MTANEFTALTAGIAYQERGIFFSELYLFALCCAAEEVDEVIESGVRNGVSTRVLHALYPDHVTSVEVRAHRVPNDLKHPVLIGDGRTLLPALVSRIHERLIGVLLDGPKGPKAQPLREQLLEDPSVRVVAVHDVPKGQGEDYHSLDPHFRETIGARLDGRIPHTIRQQHQAGAPGLGVWINR